MKKRRFLLKPQSSTAPKREFSIVLLSGFGGQPRLIAIACIVFLGGGISETPFTNNSREASHCVKLTKN